MQLPIDRLVRSLLSEAFVNRRIVILLFVGVNLLMLAVAVVWPKGYSAAAIILVEDKNIIKPLMQGAAVPTDVADRSKMVRQIIYGRKVMHQIMDFAGWTAKYPTPEAQEKLMKQLIRNTHIANVGQNFIKIEYSDDKAERSSQTAQKMAELFIHESLEAKAEESQAAYDFIDKQTKEYQEKLQRSEELLKEFRSNNIDALPGSDGDISTRLSALQQRIEQATLELREAEVKKASLEKQLSGEAEVATVISREGQYRQRIAELQNQLDQLRLSYHDTYPDIVRLRHQISDLNEAIAAEKQRREAARAAGRIEVDDNVMNNPLYQQLRHELALSKTLVDTLNARINEAKRQMQAELDRGRRVTGGAATLAELTRDYQVNRDIYQDLLKRREQARVSMNLDRDKQGLTFRIYEPATLPLQPSGLRFVHFLLIGIMLSIAIPAGLLYARLQLDPRVRFSAALGRLKLPVISSVPHLWSPPELTAARIEMRTAVLAVSGTVMLIVVVSALRIASVI